MNALYLVPLTFLAGTGVADRDKLAAIGGGSAPCTKVPSISAANSSPSSFLGGADDCGTTHVNLGTGNVTGVPFTTGTTGTTGQNEAWCYLSGTTELTNDVWFDWTAHIDGAAKLRTCGGTFVNTKIAVWPDNNPNLCPADGTSLACNDNTCDLQTSVEWNVTQGTTYTIQLGTFPGAAGGSGSFSVAVTQPPTCGRYDESNGPTALGLNAEGELAWLHYFDCMQTVHTVSTAYGEEMFPGSVSNGNHSWILVYEDASCDVDPTTGLTLRASIDTVVVNGDTGILNPNPIGPVTVSQCFWIGASADQVAGEFPGPMMHPPTPAAWVVGSTLGPGTLNIDNLNANSLPPLNMTANGYHVSWALRAEGATGPGTPYCFGDASSTTCPCNNVPGPGAGCGNGTFPEGALLAASGATQPDSIVLLAARATPSQPGLFFQGDQSLNGGNGIQFGDGLRCAGTNVVRLEVVVADPGGFATSTVSISLAGGVSSGETKFYQYWYRDPALSPCGTRFNLTNGYEITW